MAVHLHLILSFPQCKCPLVSKKIKSVSPKGNQSWVFIGRTDVEAEAPIRWSPDVKNWLIGEDPDAGKDWGQEEKGIDRGWDGWMASRLNGHEFEQTPGVGEGQGGLECCSPWGHKESDMTEQLNNYVILELDPFQAEPQMRLNSHQYLYWSLIRPQTWGHC